MAAKPSEILTSTTDAEAWSLEVERVAPHLKVTLRHDGRDWRSHLEQVNEAVRHLVHSYNIHDENVHIHFQSRVLKSSNESNFEGRPHKLSSEFF
jgi:hypothetical protein